MRISDWSSDVCSSDLVEGRLAARRELLVHILLDLVHRDVARALDHHLHILLPRAPGELAQRVELGELRLVVRVGDAAGAEAVAEGVGDVIGLHDLGDLVEAVVEKTFPVMREEPFRHDAAAAYDDSGDALSGEGTSRQKEAGGGGSGGR